MTLVKLAEDRFYLVYAAAKEASLLNWMEEQRRHEEDITFDNVSQVYGVLMLAGPKSREILAQCTNAPLTNSDFRWLSGQHITVAGIDHVRTLRVTYTGELGWELHIPMDGMLEVYRSLMRAGEPLGLIHAGMAALSSVRMEKAYVSGHEITPEVTLAEAAVTRFARSEGFQGAALSLAPASKWQLALLQLSEDAEICADPLGSESIWQGSRCVGSIASGGYGYAIGAYLCWAYLKPECGLAGTALEVMVLGQLRMAVVIDGAQFDPENRRPRQDGITAC